MDINQILLTIIVILNTFDIILVEQVEKVLYENGVPTDKKYLAAIVTSIESKFEKITVKLEGEGVPLTNEEIAARNAAHDFVYVGFTGDECKLYRDRSSGETKVSAKAKSIFLKERKDNNDDEISLDM